MRRALIIADLEGVAGVDCVSDLIFGTPGYPRAQRALTDELIVVAKALFAAGFEAVRVSDSHISGSGASNVIESLLPAGVELLFEDNAYSEMVFADVDAVACLGMHAATGAPAFAAHTVDLISAWSIDGQTLSESHLVLGLAQERDIPVLFVSGDDALQRSLPAVPFVCTKSASGSLSVDEAHRALANAAGRAPEPSPRAPAGSLQLRFKSRWQAERALEVGELRVRRIEPCLLTVDGATFRERFERAWRVGDVASDALSLRGAPGDDVFVEDVEAALRRSHERVDLRGHAPTWESCLEELHAAFMNATGPVGSDSASDAENDEVRVSLRLLTLHILEAHAPRLFAEKSWAKDLDLAIEAARRIDVAFFPGMDPDLAQARLDVWYVLAVRDAGPPEFDRARLVLTIDRLLREEPLYAWVLTEVARGGGLALDFPSEWRANPEDRMLELYHWTHEILFDTAYLHQPVSAELRPRVEPLLWAAPWVIERGHVDLASELAFCMQALGEVDAPEHARLLEFVLEHIEARGVVDRSMDVDPREMLDHASAVALVALAGAMERAAG